MLSPGTFHKQVPRGFEANLLYREKLLESAAKSLTGQKDIWAACRDDLLFYVSAFCFTYDPRKSDKSLPFIPYPFQEKAFLEILLCIEEGRDLVIEKSRDMGASWMSLTVMEWLWHFHPGNSFLMVSRKEDMVDAPGDPDSLFWKVDFILRHLPRWLAPDLDRRRLHFGNLVNGSTIDGESTTAAAGVGGRRTALFIDEFSRIEEGYHLLAGTADTTRCRIFNFTPWGTSNAAYRLATQVGVRKLRLHWSEHPEKARGLYRYSEKLGRVEKLDATFDHGPDYNFILDGKLRSPWYDGECERRANDREVAEMIDIDYGSSVYQFFDKHLISQLQGSYCVPPFWEGDIAFDPDTGRPKALIPQSNGPLKLWLHPNTDGKPPEAPYAGGADLATGLGATNSCLTFLDCRTGEKVLEYVSPHLKPDEMAIRATALCWLFKDESGEGCRFAWEHAGPGQEFGKRVLELGYSNYYRRESTRGMGQQSKASDTPGWYPSNDQKYLLISEYRTAIATRQFINRSFAALEETLRFIFRNGIIEHSGESEGINDRGIKDPSGARVNHGDRVIADALAWKICKQRGILGRKSLAASQAPVGSLAWRRMLAEEHRRKQEEW